MKVKNFIAQLVTIAFFVIGVAAGIFFHRPEWITFGVIIMLGGLLELIIKKYLPEKATLILRQLGVLALGGLSFIVVKYPYFLTPDFLASEVDFSKFEKRGDFTKKYKNRKVSFKGMITGYQQSLGYGMGDDRMVTVEMTTGDDIIIVMYDENSTKPAPKVRDTIRFTGVVKSYMNGSKAIPTATSIEILDEPLKPSTFKELTMLDLTPETIGRMKNLTIQNEPHYYIPVMPEEIFKLENLNYLAMHHTEMESIGSGIEKLKKLDRIRFTDLKNLKSLPDQFGNLSEMKDIEIAGCAIEKLPNSFCGLMNLGKLNLIHNKLKSLPDSFGKLSKLYSLTLSNNSLEKLPKSLGDLSELYEFNASHNQLKDFPDQLAQIDRLDRINIQNNQIKSIPADLTGFKNLRKLDLSGNQITEIPDTIASFPKLEELIVTGNKISKLPESIKDMKALRTLDLKGNPIADIPEFIYSMPKISKLILTDTKIPESRKKEIADKFQDLKNKRIRRNRTKVYF